MKNNLTGQTNTEHSINPVPFWFITGDNHKRDPSRYDSSEEKVAGLLSDVAPTIVELLGLEKPREMTGESLLPNLK
jgi:2,3-bisphosphoglycerate-independent phosphoglycerate mutase